MPGETRSRKMVRFRTLGCYPLTGAIESSADDASGDRPRDADRPHVRALRAASSTTTSRFDGEEEARRVLLMAHARASSTPAAFTDYLAAQERKGLLRFITCGSVDDGKSTLIGRLLYDSKLIFEDQLADARARQPQARHARRGLRLRASRRRARGRARAGHHHRRRLSLLHHGQAQVHRRRHARPRAVHPQHGDRRLDRRPRHACSSTPARACSRRRAATPSSPRCSASATSCWRSTRWTWSTSTASASRRSSKDFADVRLVVRLRDAGRDPDLGPLRRQRHDAQRPYALVSLARP
jgi:3'-phosphoadenosine 5'-phosphosulfate sulfotransferase (PAPS reductase)/FAD synthetase